MINIILLHPQIPQNTGAIARSVACFGAKLHLIEPLGFVFSMDKMKRGGMDYLEIAPIERHSDIHEFQAKYKGRNILMTTHGSSEFNKFIVHDQDNIYFGNESSGAKPEYHAMMAHRLRIGIMDNTRSLNLAVSAAIVLYEAHKQLTP